MADTEALKNDYETFLEDMSQAEKEHDEYLHLYREMTRRQDASAKTLTHLTYCYKRFRADVKRLDSKKEKTPEEAQMLATMKSKLAEVSVKLSEMERELPAKDIGPYLSIILGSNLNISLLNPDDRYKYKQEYESFKLTVTYVILECVFTLAYFVPFRAVDALCNFLLVWYYCTLTIRESILRVNGSRIKGWWVFHHYISCVLCGITLTWRDGTCYKEFRPQFILLACYIGSVQLLQTKYQTGCLRRLHALGQRHSMDISTEGFSSFMFKGLTFLLPFLIGGYIIQGYCSYTLFKIYMRNCKDWQVITLAILFAVITFGNIITTLLVVVRKCIQIHRGNSSNHLVSKYRLKKSI
uniref:Transmembrane protein 120A n=1 Tax=Ditylenchus dipsaci TaxID=166011 RepID=A0A915CT12_9BILA